MDAGRVRGDDYRLIMFRTNDDTASAFALVQRSVQRTRHNGTPAIRVREHNRAQADAVTIYIHAHSLRPISYDATFGDTLSVTATMDGDSMRVTERRHGVTTSSAAEAGPGVYFSNAFSELVQANDFEAHPHISFTTMTPGAGANTFDVERVGRRTFEHGVVVWVLRFTRVDAHGARVPAGYRYVDAGTGKVLFFATERDSRSGFSYQVLPLK
jgi:hypothetical protein